MKLETEQVVSANHTKRLLISFAHPDDESFGMGGVIAYYVARGIEVSLICSTNGDVGTVDPEFMRDYDTVADLRLAELRCAADMLGIKNVITYGYRDSGMMGTPENEHPDCLWQEDEAVVVEKIVRDIRRLRPHVIVTFDPWGGYGHPDHIYMHRATTKAFHAAADPDQFPDQIVAGLEPYQPEKLYYNTFPRLIVQLRIWQARLSGQDPRRMGRNQDLDMIAILDRSLPAHAAIPVAAYRAAWDAASDCHASQQNPRQQSSVLNYVQRLMLRRQKFTRVYPAPNGHQRLERDLFAGI